MKNLFFALIALFGMQSMTVSAQVDAEQPITAPRVVGYFASWGIYDETPYLVTDIPAELLTHVNYAFINVDENGECVFDDVWGELEYPYPNDGPLGNLAALEAFKAEHPHLKTLMALGGWARSVNFSDAALTPESRDHFARSCVTMMNDYGFDGIDVDWEYPVAEGDPGNITRPEDKANYTLLLAELRQKLNALSELTGQEYLLTIAAPAGPQSRYYELDKIHEYLDWINLMTYDYSGHWSAATAFNAPLHSTPSASSVANSVETYLAAGVPAEKLVLGVPFYGKAWEGVAARNDGLAQRPSGPFGSSDGALTYRQIVEDYHAGTGFTRHWHEVSQVPWLYNADTGVMISYDDPESIALKAAFAREQGLGGVMLWELRQDSADHALLTAIHQGLSGE
jgi:chitinase